jgi:hypothetical protein
MPTYHYITTVPVIVNIVGLIMVVVHPQPLDDCPCFEDAIAFLSVVMGIVTARWAFVRHNLSLASESPNISKSKSIIEPALSALKDSVTGMKDGSQNIQSVVINSIFTTVRKTAMVIVGIIAILTVRIVVKAICRVVLPPIFRFAIDSLGLILPRRHYQPTSTLASPQRTTKPVRPAHKRRQSSAGGDFFSNASDPREYDSVYWKLDNRSLDQQNNDQKQSEAQIRTARAERSKVKFTLGDGSDVPVPFTHPNTHLPGDGISGRLAGAFSVDEKQRQLREMQSSYEFPTRQQQENGIKANGNGTTEHHHQHNHDASAPDASHYDVDVLTKVFVYHAIGFFAGGPIPALLTKLGW